MSKNTIRVCVRNRIFDRRFGQPRQDRCGGGVVDSALAERAVRKARRIVVGADHDFRAPSRDRDDDIAALRPRLSLARLDRKWLDGEGNVPFCQHGSEGVESRVVCVTLHTGDIVLCP